MKQAQVVIQAIKNIHHNKNSDALTDPTTLAKAVQIGILDAPHLKNSAYAKGEIRTSIIDGACQAIDEDGKPLTEEERLAQYL